jgi:hypothetical protein
VKLDEACAKVLPAFSYLRVVDPVEVGEGLGCGVPGAAAQAAVLWGLLHSSLEGVVGSADSRVERGQERLVGEAVMTVHSGLVILCRAREWHRVGLSVRGSLVQLVRILFSGEGRHSEGEDEVEVIEERECGGVSSSGGAGGRTGGRRRDSRAVRGQREDVENLAREREMLRRERKKVMERESENWEVSGV